MLLAGIALTVYLTNWIGSPVGGDKSSVLVVVRKGSGANDVAVSLTEKGLVRFPQAFILISRARGEAGKIKPGAYRFDRSMSVGDMLDDLVAGKVASVWVTIPEGYTIRDIAELLDDKKLADGDEFLRIASFNAQDFKEILDVPAPGLEGYLFPSTYLVPLEGESREIIAGMLRAFKAQVYDQLSKDIAQASGDGSPESIRMTLHRIVTVASMIEREAQVAEERPLISAVIRNRMKIGMKLDIDATVRYATGKYRTRLYYSDLEVDSPYNTYRRPGLPPGPIANPGLDSVKAALHPANVEYLYYVAREDGSGWHVFSRTFEEHKAAIRKIRNGR